MSEENTSERETKSTIKLSETFGVYIIMILIFYISGGIEYLDERTIETFTWLFILSLIVVLIIGIQFFIFRGRFKPRKSVD